MGIRLEALLVSTLAGACFSDSGTGQTGASTTTSSSSSSSTAGTSDGATGEPEACPGDAPCVQIPPGWSGPVVARLTEVGSPPTNCEVAEYPMPEESLLGDFDPGSPQCQCGCSVAEITRCEAAVLGRHSDMSCATAALETWNLPPGDCQTTIGIQASGFFGLTAPVPSGACTVEAVLDPTTVAGFGSQWQTCSAAALPSCGSGTCVPQIPQGVAFDRLCIRTDGSAMCPPGGFFAAEYHVFASQAGEVTCDGLCLCGPPGPACRVGASWFDDAACGNFLGSVDDGDCIPVGVVGVNSLQLTTADLPVDLACSPTAAMIPAGGSVAPTGETTLCCTQ